MAMLPSRMAIRLPLPLRATRVIAVESWICWLRGFPVYYEVVWRSKFQAEDVKNTIILLGRDAGSVENLCRVLVTVPYEVPTYKRAGNRNKQANQHQYRNVNHHSKPTIEPATNPKGSSSAQQVSQESRNRS
ncbi:unnamed protein product [Ectocarpus sp. 6 AP-2014]